jgi:two-component system OmpR family sensor kinase
MPSRPTFRTLRVRMAVAYTLLTLAITSVLAVAAFVALSLALEQGVRNTVTGSARALAAMIEDPSEALFNPPEVAPDVYYQLEDSEGYPVLASANLEGANLPGSEGFVQAGRTTLYVERQPWTRNDRRIGTMAVGVDATATARTRGLAGWLLSAFVLMSTGLALPLGFIIGGRSLRRLEEAARLAANVNPVDPRPLKLSGPTDDEIGTLAVALDRTLERIREHQFAERTFLAEVAHELGSPITVLNGRLERLADENPDPRLRSALEAAQDIARTSEDLLLLARGGLATSGRAPARERYLVDLRGLVARVIDEFEDGARIEFDAPPEPLEVIGDPHGLRQAIRNLMRNAVRAAAVTRGDVRVKLSREPSGGVLEIEDEGPGIRPDDLEHIFERFYSRSGGSGVGLAVVRQVARDHGGEAYAENRTGGGACFRLVIPLAGTSDD